MLPEPRQVRVGDIVLFALSSGANHPGELRPAIVVRVWSEYSVNLQVFIEEHDFPDYFFPDERVPGSLWKTSVPFGPDCGQGTWSWLEAKG
jgi:hypothetical protein